LREVTDAEFGAAIHRQQSDVLAIDDHGAGFRGHEASHGVKAGGFARAIGAKQGHNLAAGQFH